MLMKSYNNDQFVKVLNLAQDTSYPKHVNVVYSDLATGLVFTMAAHYFFGAVCEEPYDDTDDVLDGTGSVIANNRFVPATQAEAQAALGVQQG